jgi:hypothetical protein
MGILTLYALEAEHNKLARELRGLLIEITGDRNLAGRFARLEPDITRVTHGLKALETSIQMFEPDWTPERNPIKRKWTPKSPFAFRELRGHIMVLLREDRRWKTLRQVTDEVFARNLPDGLSTDDRNNLQRSIWSQLERDADAGIIEDDGRSPARWRFVPKEARLSLRLRRNRSTDAADGA